MTYPTAAVATANLDAGTDSPATARSDLLDAVQKLNQMIAHTTAFAATLLDGVDAAAVRATLVAAASGSNPDITSWSGGPLAGFRNRIINGNFGVNQRAYASGAAVGAGLYGHDRWKMAASGDTYTFSTTANVTTVTIPASKVLQQVIEGLNLETGTYTLSWSGTAQGKIGAGSYGASGITGAITGGTNTTIEFGPGTVSKVQLEFGSTATAFEQRPYGMELSLCQRYLPVVRNVTGSSCEVGIGQALSTSGVIWSCPLPEEARVSPTGITYSAVSALYLLSQGGSSFNANAITFMRATTISATLSISSTYNAYTAGDAALIGANGNSYVLFTGCEL